MIEKVVTRAKNEINWLGVYANPRKVFYNFKGIGNHGYYRYFADYFNAGGISGGALLSSIVKKKIVYHTAAWYSESLDTALNGSLSTSHAGFLSEPGIEGGKGFCLAVMRKGTRRNRPFTEEEKTNPSGAKRGRQIFYWRNVPTIFMDRFQFDRIKEIYTDLLKTNTDMISWEKFCKKVVLVNDNDDFYSKMNRFLLFGRRLGRVRSGLTSEDLIIN